MDALLDDYKMTEAEFKRIQRLVIAEHLGDSLAEWLTSTVEKFNRDLFGDDIQHPALNIELLPYGGCVGLCRTAKGRPFIRLSRQYFNWDSVQHDDDFPHRLFCEDILIHELTHAYVEHHGRGKGPTSHDCDGWCNQVNRVSPLIGLPEVKASRKKSVRIPIGRDASGRKRYKIEKQVPEDCLSMSTIARWPHSCRPAGYFPEDGLPS